MEAAVRLAIFLTLLITMTGLESVLPRRVRTSSRRSRWLNHLTLAVANTVLLRVLFPVAAVGCAALAARRGWGLLAWSNLPPALDFPVGFAALDLLIYAQHRVFHRIHIFWRIHCVHHSDVDLDASSALRFHPLEMALSMLVKMGAVVAIGVPPVTVIVFEAVLNGVSMFNHANFRIPERVDRVLRRFVVTPDMHRVHHSVVRQETDSNFGFNLPWWDRLFGTYRAQPSGGHLGMRIGLEWTRPARPDSLGWLLALPFLGSR